MKEPKNKRQVRQFLGRVNFYRKMWERRSYLLAALADLTGDVPFKWECKHRKAFDEIKAVMANEVMLRYPDFSKSFHMFPDASDKQLESHVAQLVSINGDEKEQPTLTTGTKRDKAPNGFFFAPAFFHSRKLNLHQIKYPTTDRELLSIVDTLLEFRTLLCGIKIVVHADHKNLTHNNTLHVSSRVQRQRLIADEFGCEILHIPGEDNAMADAMSRLGTNGSNEASISKNIAG